MDNPTLIKCNIGKFYEKNFERFQVQFITDNFKDNVTWRENTFCALF